MTWHSNMRLHLKQHGKFHRLFSNRCCLFLILFSYLSFERIRFQFQFRISFYCYYVLLFVIFGRKYGTFETLASVIRLMQVEHLPNKFDALKLWKFRSSWFYDGDSCRLLASIMITFEDRMQIYWLIIFFYIDELIHYWLLTIDYIHSTRNK